MTSVELLERAAKALRDHANGLPNTMIGRWRARHGVVADDGTDVGMLVIDPYNPADDQPIIDFVALLDPPVAIALAITFDRVAWTGRLDADLLSRVGHDELVAVARAILREEP